MDHQGKAVILVDLSPVSLREAFACADDESRDQALLGTPLTFDFYKWPLDRFSIIMSSIDSVMPSVAITNKELIAYEDNLDDQRISASIWMNVSQYLALHQLIRDGFAATHPEDLSRLEEFERAALSFHFPARVKIYENGAEVGTAESAPFFVMKSQLMIEDNNIIADCSDMNDCPQERQDSEKFTKWFKDRLATAARPGQVKQTLIPG